MEFDVGTATTLSGPGAGGGAGAGVRVRHRPGRTAPIWLQRLSLFVLVLFCVYLGVLVMALPWWTRIWDRNEFILARPWLAAVLHNGAVRRDDLGTGTAGYLDWHFRGSALSGLSRVTSWVTRKWMSRQ